MKLLRHLVCTTAGLVIAAAPGLAAATPTFPQAIVTDLTLTYSLGTPACQTNPTPRLPLHHLPPVQQRRHRHGHPAVRGRHESARSWSTRACRPCKPRSTISTRTRPTATATSSATSSSSGRAAIPIPARSSTGPTGPPRRRSPVTRPSRPSVAADRALRRLRRCPRAPWEGAATIVAVLGVALARHAASEVNRSVPAAGWSRENTRKTPSGRAVQMRSRLSGRPFAVVLRALFRPAPGSSERL